MAEAYRMHRLADNQTLSDADCAGIKSAVEFARQLHFQAGRHIAESGLDSSLFLPGPVWQEFVKADYTFAWPEFHINLTRALSTFSGFHLFVWAHCSSRWYDAEKATAFYDKVFEAENKTGDFYETVFCAANPGALLDKILDDDLDVGARMQMSASTFVEGWERMVASVPEKYWLTLPPVAGEVGIIHRNRIINHDLIGYQTRVNALYGAGVLDRIEDTIARHGHATYMEIGSGSGAFAFALSQCFGGALRVCLIDLPQSLCSAVGYLGLAAGIEAVEVVGPGQDRIAGKPYTLIANYLLPHYDGLLPKFDVVHNAISLNEMTAAQVDYYGRFIKAHLAEAGVFHLAQGESYNDGHVNALEIMNSIFDKKDIVRGNELNGVRLQEDLNTFYFL